LQEERNFELGTAVHDKKNRSLLSKDLPNKQGGTSFMKAGLGAKDDTDATSESIQINARGTGNDMATDEA